MTVYLGYSNTAFLVTIEGFISPVPDPVVFNLTQFNPGEHYDPQTGIYTVPFDGKYMFTATLRGQPDHDFGAVINVDGIRTVENRNADNGGLGNISASISIILYLTSGQEISVSPYDLDLMWGGSAGGITYSWFTGYLISAD